jgi:hypothetical protein
MDERERAYVAEVAQIHEWYNSQAVDPDDQDQLTHDMVVKLTEAHRSFMADNPNAATYLVK